MNANKTHRVLVYVEDPRTGEKVKKGWGPPMCEEQAQNIADSDNEKEQNPLKTYKVEPVE